jgi:hypothetical protein
MNRPRPYVVTSGRETPEEPFSGVYWTHEDEHGDLVVHGPYRNRRAAEDAIDQWMFDQGEAL